MTNYIGKNIEEILEKASIEKNCNKEELYYFIQEEKKGFLGFGSKVLAFVYNLEDVGTFACNYLDNYFQGIELKTSIEGQIEDKTIKITIDAENNAVLIGKFGQTLRAINTVVRSACSSHFKKRFNIIVDINNYKEERYEKVKAIAIREAKKVARSKVDVTLDPMPNDERKIIHQTLSDFKKVRTESIDEGNNRRVKIIYDDNKK